jgi:hypothetical protein
LALTATSVCIIDAFMRTTIDINDALLAELRQRAAKTGQPFRKVVEEILQIGLAGQAKATRKPRLKTYPVGIKPAYRGVSLNQLYDQLEAESHPKVTEE